MRKIAISILLNILTFTVSAQIYTRHNLFTENMYLYNPAYAGSSGSFAAFIDYKNHLSSIPDAPKTATLGIHSPVFNNMGMGLLLKTERIGLFETAQLRLDYSYKVRFSNIQTLSFGINGGLMQRNLDNDNVIAFDDIDPTLQSGYYDQKLFFLGGGLNYNLANYNFSLSLPVLYRNDNQLFYKTIAYTSYKFNIGIDDKFALKPAVSLELSETDLNSYQIHLSAIYNDIYRIRGSYEQNGGIIAAVGLAVGKLGIEYAYATNSKDLSYIGGASHEICLSYGLFKTKPDIRIPPDTAVIPQEKTYIHQLKRMIEDENYDQFVKAGNFAFYNEIISLTDSMYRGTPPPNEIDSAEIITSDDYKKPNHIVQKDTIRKETKTEIVETVTKPDPTKKLTNEEIKLFEKGVHFKEGSSMLNQASREYLDEIAELLINNPNISILIQGHTCDIGSKEVNLKLSAERAETVRYYLELKGVPTELITTDAKADAEPIVPNTNEANRRLNRRVSFSIIRD